MLLLLVPREVCGIRQGWISGLRKEGASFAEVWLDQSLQQLPERFGRGRLAPPAPSPPRAAWEWGI